MKAELFAMPSSTATKVYGKGRSTSSTRDFVWNTAKKKRSWDRVISVRSPQMISITAKFSRAELASWCVPTAAQMTNRCAQIVAN